MSRSSSALEHHQPSINHSSKFYSALFNHFLRPWFSKMSVKNRAIWADVLMEQDLSESISDLSTAFKSTNEEKENKK